MRSVILFMLIGLLVVAGGCAHKYELQRDMLSVESPWPFPRGEAGSLGSVSDGGFSGELDPVWEGKTGGKPVAPLSIQHNALVLPDAKKRVNFYDIETGQYQGKIACKGIPMGGLVADDSLAFYAFGPRKNKLFGYNLLNRKVLWEQDVKDASPGSIIVGSSLIVSSGNGLVSAFRKETGKLLWSFKTEGRFIVPASSAAGRIYQPGDNGVLHVLSADDGHELFADTLDAPLVSQVAAAGMIYVADLNGTVYGLDGETGEVTWRSRLPGPIWNAPTVQGERVYVAANRGVTVSLDASTGREIWRHEVGEIVKVPPLAIGGYLVIGTASGKIISLRATDGEEIARAEVKGSIDFAPITDGKRVYVASSKGKIACFGEAYEYSNQSNHRDVVKDRPQ